MTIFFIIIIIAFIIAFITLIRTEKYEVTYEESDIDNKEYLVRDLPDKKQSANLLAKLKQNMLKLVDELYKKKDSEYNKYKIYIEQLQERIKNVIINESSEDNAYTSYSVNKGEQIVFCLRSKQDNQLHELNLLIYVSIHEMSHIGNPEYGHGELFKKIFSFFIKVAIDMGIYKKIDFPNNPTEYCGMTISESII